MLIDIDDKIHKKKNDRHSYRSYHLLKGPIQFIKGNLQPVNHRKSFLKIFPVVPFGKSSLKWTVDGNLYLTRFSLQKLIISCSDKLLPGFSTTCACTSSPRSSCGIPTTAASTMSG